MRMGTMIMTMGMGMVTLMDALLPKRVPNPHLRMGPRMPMTTSMTMSMLWALQ